MHRIISVEARMRTIGIRLCSNRWHIHSYAMEATGRTFITLLPSHTIFFWSRLSSIVSWCEQTVRHMTTLIYRCVPIRYLLQRPGIPWSSHTLPCIHFSFLSNAHRHICVRSATSDLQGSWEEKRPHQLYIVMHLILMWMIIVYF